MRIRPAWTKEMQALAHDPHVVAVVDAALIPGALGTVAEILRNYVEPQSEKLDHALEGAVQVLSTVQARATALRVVETLRALYNGAPSAEDLAKKRGKVLELLVFRCVAQFYAEGECHTDCCVSGSGEHYRRLEGREFDICAWDNDAKGEAYECGVRPNKLAAQDYTALATLTKAIMDEYGDRHPWFRPGFVSFEHSRHVKRLIEELGPAAGDPHLEADIEAFGYNNLMDLCN